MSWLVPLLLKEAIWSYCNGWETRAVPGMHRQVTMLLKEAIYRYFSGPEAKVVPGMSGHVSRLSMEAIWRCSNGSEAKVVLGMYRQVTVQLIEVTEDITMGAKPRKSLGWRDMYQGGWRLCCLGRPFESIAMVKKPRLSVEIQFCCEQQGASGSVAMKAVIVQKGCY